MKVDGEKKTSSGGRESPGHESGRMIVELLDKKKADLDGDDVAQTKRVAGYVHRHLAEAGHGRRALPLALLAHELGP